MVGGFVLTEKLLFGLEVEKAGLLNLLTIKVWTAELRNLHVLFVSFSQKSLSVKVEKLCIEV